MLTEKENKVICLKCKKPITEKTYPFLQMVLGDVNSPVAADPRRPIHAKCLRENLDIMAFTNEEKQQALEVLSYFS